MSKYDSRMLFVMALGVFVFFIVDMSDIANHPDIWSPLFVLIFNIITKVIGVITSLTGIIMFSFFEPKKDK